MMKNYTTALLLLMSIGLAFSAYSQDDPQATPADTVKDWKIGGAIAINFSQSAFSNWAAGGENNVGISSFYKPFANYKKGKISWDNALDLRYGKNKLGEQGWRKSDDLIDLNSKLGIQTSKRWFFSVIVNFSSQFDKGFSDAAQTQQVSGFMSPGYLTFAHGMDFKPDDKLSVFISPLTSRTTFVMDDSLSNAGAYGVEIGEKSWTQLGPSVVITYKNEIVENVVIDTRIRSLYEYASDAKFIFNWDMILSMKVNKFLAANITTGLIYDDNVEFAVYDDAGVVTGTEKRWQFKEVLAIGVTFTY